MVLDNVRSALNVGSAFRTADSFASGKNLFVWDNCAASSSRNFKNSHWRHRSLLNGNILKTLTAAIEELIRKDKYRVVGVEQTDESTALQDFELKK